MKQVETEISGAEADMALSMDKPRSQKKER